MDFESETFLVAHSLRGEGFDASEDGTGRGTPLVPVAVPIDMRQARRGATLTNSGRSDNPLSGSPGLGVGEDGDPAYTLGQECGAVATIAFDCMASGMNGFGIGEVANPQRVGTNSSGAAHQAVATGMQVRRLTPLETERLMGLPDGYTAIQVKGKPAADGPRYKSHGNSWALNCPRWIGDRIEAVEAICINSPAHRT
jgi:DNA (cytosine-5)-methyltransferase 1